MDSKDKIDLALRGAIIAQAALEMISVGDKVHAKIICANIVDRVVDLDKTILRLLNDEAA